MPSTWYSETLIKMMMKGYLKHLNSTYPLEKKTLVTSKKNIKRFCQTRDGAVADKVIEMMEKNELAVVFSEGKRPYYEIDLRKMRSYLLDNPIGSE